MNTTNTVRSTGLQEFIPGVWYEMRDGEGRTPESITFWSKRVSDKTLMGVSFRRGMPFGVVDQMYLVLPVPSFDRAICRKASITWAEECVNAQEFHVFSK